MGAENKEFRIEQSRLTSKIEVMQRDWTVIVSGVVSQQLANAPEETFEGGRFTSTLPGLVEMFVAHYGSSARKSARPSSTTSTRRGHASKR